MKLSELIYCNRSIIVGVMTCHEILVEFIGTSHCYQSLTRYTLK